MRKLCVAAVAVAVSLASGQSQAAWQRASSKHFVIYADSSPKKLQDFGERLEKFDKAVRHVRNMSDPEIGDGNRVTLFVVPGQSAVIKLAHDKTGSVTGFYEGRARGSIAVIPRSLDDDHRAGAMTSETVFFHEYAHHLMLSDTSRPYPEWLIEGFAEFMSTALFEKDGGVGLGPPPQFRAYELVVLSPIPIERLLSGNFNRLSNTDQECFYGRSWLLTHYLNFSRERHDQVEKYLEEFDKGIPSVTAARDAFGDLKTLDKELQLYLARPKMAYMKVSASKLAIGSVKVEPVSPGAAAVMADRIQSKVGVDKSTAEPLAERVRAAERRFPGDPFVERTLAEAELDAHHPASSLAAAERALKTDPSDVEAMLFKGRAIEEGTSTDRFVTARRLFIAANKIDTEDPEPLALFYGSFLHEGAAPNANAIAALHYASDLAPQDTGLRMTSAIQYLRDGKIPEGRTALMSVAYDPHGESAAALARTMLARVDAGDTTGALGLVKRE